jgi:hypothetical protein
VVWFLGIMPRMLYRSSRRWASWFSRRSFLKQLSLVAGALPIGKLPSSAAFSAASLLGAFEEIPASRSGITWVHTAGKSAEKHLPETSGAGARFLTTTMTGGWTFIW